MAPQKPIVWASIKRILVVRLRSIGDTVLSTPSLIALRRFLPDAQIDILLEDWVAPLLEGFDAVDNVIRVGKGSAERLKIARDLRRSKYDIAFNLHGGTTATLFVSASGAKHRVGFANYQYSFLYNHLLSSASDFWHVEFTHSAEQQLALLGFIGVPVEDRPKTRLKVSELSVEGLAGKLRAKRESSQADARVEKATEDVGIAWSRERLETTDYAIFHPSSAFFTKQWATENFARIAEFLAEKGIQTIAVASKNESAVLENLKQESKVPITTFDDLSLPEITALAAKAKIFVGNDSGIAHIAGAMKTPSVVIFGSSNRNHWRPWTDAPNEIVFEEFACQPCPGYRCEVFGEPRCILSISPKSVEAKIEKILANSTKKGEPLSPPILPIK